MSTSEILSMISLISFVLAGVSAVLAVVFWFVFKIPAVIGDLSGRTARKSIEKMRVNNEKTGKKDFAPSKTNLKRGKVTELINEPEKESGKLAGMLSGKLDNKKKKISVEEENLETGLLEENMQSSYDSEETGLLTEESMETELLETELLEETEETGLLVEDNETMLLVDEEEKQTEMNGFVMLEEIMLIHTEETID